VRVNGQDAAPVYKFLKASKPGFFGSRIKWNFTKFLVGKDGKVIARYATLTTPLSIEVSLSGWITYFLSLSLSGITYFLYFLLHWFRIYRRTSRRLLRSRCDALCHLHLQK
jgi:glutathione peroxidase